MQWAAGLPEEQSLNLLWLCISDHLILGRFDTSRFIYKLFQIMTLILHSVQSWSKICAAEQKEIVLQAVIMALVICVWRVEDLLHSHMCPKVPHSHFSYLLKLLGLVCVVNNVFRLSEGSEIQLKSYNFWLKWRVLWGKWKFVRQQKISDSTLRSISEKSSHFMKVYQCESPLDHTGLLCSYRGSGVSRAASQWDSAEPHRDRLGLFVWSSHDLLLFAWLSHCSKRRTSHCVQQYAYFSVSRGKNLKRQDAKCRVLKRWWFGATNKCAMA